MMLTTDAEIISEIGMDLVPVSEHGASASLCVSPPHNEILEKVVKEVV